MGVISQVIVLFFAQTILEVVVMALLAKFGVPYMDFNSSGEDVTELLMSIGYYYSFSKSIIIILPYIALMLLGNRIIKKVSFPQLNIPISVVLSGLFWLGFNNPIGEMLNPLFGSLLVGLFILFIIKIVNPAKV